MTAQAKRRKSVCRSKVGLVQSSAVQMSSTKRKQTVSVLNYADLLKEESLTSLSSTEVFDIYKDLRYHEENSRLPAPRNNHRRLQTKPVSVRKLKQETVKTIVPEPPKLRLALPVGEQDEDLQVYSKQTSMVQRRTQALHHKLRQDLCIPALRKRDLTAQEASLSRWTEERQREAALKQRLSQRAGRVPENLCLSRPLSLPPKENHRGPSYGPQSDFPQWTQHERFYRNDAFFLLPTYIGPEDDSFGVTLKWSERQLYKPPLTIVRPTLDKGESSFQDSSVRTSRDGAEVTFSYQQEEGKENEEERNAAEKPKMEAQLESLYLQGRIVDSPESTEVESRTEDDPADTPELSLDVLRASLDSNLHDFRVSRHKLIRTDCQPCGPRLDSPYFVRNVVPAFQLDRFTYVWGHPCLHDIVEIGVVCNAGEKGCTEIRLANVGCCTISYSWRHQPHVDHFNSGRYRISPFIFNCSDGILLPEEKLSLNVRFLSQYPGCWTERWFLCTTPCVGPGGQSEIPVNLWGQASEVDVHLTHRAQLEKQLEINTVKRMCERDTWDLIKFLPLRSRHRKLQERVSPIPEGRGQDDVAGFLSHNPGLYYHSVPMVQLLIARHYLRLAKLAMVSPSPKQLERDPLSVKRESTVTFAPQRSRSVSRLSFSSTPPISNNGSNVSVKAADRRRSPSPSPWGSRVAGPATSGTSSFSRYGRRSRVTSGEDNDGINFTTVDSFNQPRAEVGVREMYRSAHALEEGAEKKEEIVKNINQAISAMSFKPFAPPMRHYKRIIMRQALVKLCDAIDRAEWRLRRNLCLQEDPRFTKLATFPQDLYKSAGSKGKTGKDRVKLRKVTVSNRFSRSPSSGLVETFPAEPIDWKKPIPSHYRFRLRQKIQALVTGTLEAMLPVITYDGYRMNPLLPAPEP